MSSKIRGLTRQSVRTMVGKKVVAFMPNKEGLDVFIVESKDTLKSVSTGELHRVEKAAFITASQKPFASALELARDGKEVDVFDAFRQMSVKNCKFVKGKDQDVFLLSNNEDLRGSPYRDMQGYQYSWWIGQPERKRFFVEKVHHNKVEVEETAAKVEKPRKSSKIELNKRFKGKYRGLRAGDFEDGMLIEEDGEIFLLTNNVVLDGCECKDKKGYEFSWFLSRVVNDEAEQFLDFKGYLEDEPVKEESSLVLNKYCSLKVDLGVNGYVYLSDAKIVRDSVGDYFVVSNVIRGDEIDKEYRKGFKYSWYIGSTEDEAKSKLSCIEYFEAPITSMQDVMKELLDIKEILNKHFR